MMATGCFECGGPGPLHDHHVVPRSLGGTKTVPLCEPCHGKVHGKDMRISRLTRMGLERARQSGVRLGGSIFDDAVSVEMIVSLVAAGATYQEVADTLTAEGVPTKRGGSWQPTTVRQIALRAGYDGKRSRGRSAPNPGAR